MRGPARSSNGPSWRSIGSVCGRWRPLRITCDRRAPARTRESRRSPAHLAGPPGFNSVALPPPKRVKGGAGRALRRLSAAPVRSLPGQGASRRKLILKSLALSEDIPVPGAMSQEKPAWCADAEETSLCCVGIGCGIRLRWNCLSHNNLVTPELQAVQCNTRGLPIQQTA